MKTRNNTKHFTSMHICLILFLAICINLITLWAGRGFDDSGLALFEPIRKSETAQMYTRTHPISYAIWSISNKEIGDTNHWAKNQIAFFQEKTGVSLDNPDEEANISLLNEQIGINTKNNLRVSWFSHQLIYKSFIGIVALALLIPLSLCKKFSKKENMLIVAAICIAFGTVSTLNSVLLIILYIMIWKKVTDETSVGYAKSMIIATIGSVFCSGILAAKVFLMSTDIITLMIPLILVLIGVITSIFMIATLFNIKNLERHLLSFKDVSPLFSKLL